MSATLCQQFAWDKTVPVSAEKPTNLHNRHAWHTHCFLLHTVPLIRSGQTWQCSLLLIQKVVLAVVLPSMKIQPLQIAFFHERITKFMKYFYVDILGATDFWFRFEWQYRGSPHVHGVAWLQNAPQAEQLLSADNDLKLLDAVEQITSYVDSLVSTMNPGIPAHSNNIVHAVPIPKIKEHVCNRKF